MAIWQFSLHAVPRSAVRKGDVDKLHLEKAELENIELNIGPDEASAIQATISGFLPERRPWHADLSAWG